MKKIFIGLMALVSLVSMTSCEDFLNQPIPDTTNEPLVFSKAEYIEANLMGCYHYFKSTSTMSYTFMGSLLYLTAFPKDTEGVPRKDSFRP